MVHRLAASRRPAVALLTALTLLATILLPATVAGGRQEPRQRGSGPQRGALLVKVKSSADPLAVTAAVSAAGGTELGRLDELDTRVVQAPAGRQAQFRQQLLASPQVLSVEEDGEARATLIPNDPLWWRQWSVRKVRGPSAWDVATGQGGPIVAVIDTGVDGSHPDLSGRLVPGWNFHANSANTSDDADHGTAVAGIIAGVGNNGLGTAGLCWRCRIMPIKVLGANGGGSWSNIAAGIVWAANNGARVINLSLGGPTGSLALRDAVRYAIARGAVVVAAAGNEGSRQYFYPAAYTGVLAVAATTSSDRLYSFSNRGSWVDVAAPGCTWSPAPRATWRSFCGTSAAAPSVSGIAGLVISRAAGASRQQVQTAIVSTAVEVGAFVRGGRVDAAAAVRQLGISSTAPTTDPTPKPSPSPSPTPTPAVPADGEAVWRDRLYSGEDEDSNTFAFGGAVRIDAYWSSSHDLRIDVHNSRGERVATLVADGDGDDDWSHDAFERQLPPDKYRLTVSSATGGETYYRLEIRWHD
jgi:subtilisin family serine protease